jgi:NADH:ubiquinone oxidoreductase subunit 6 (subunit J)
MKNFLLAKDVNNANDLANRIQKLLESILGPILIVVGAAAAIYAIYLGVMYAKAEDANKRKEVQGRLIGAIIGAVIILVGVALVYAINWETLLSNAQKGEI